MTRLQATVITAPNGIPCAVKTKHQELLSVTDISSTLPLIQPGDRVLLLANPSAVIVLELIEPVAFHQPKFIITQKDQQTLTINTSIGLSKKKGLTIKSKAGRQIHLSPQGCLNIKTDKIYLSSKKNHFIIKAQSLQIQSTHGETPS